MFPSGTRPVAHFSTWILPLTVACLLLACWAALLADEPTEQAASAEASAPSQAEEAPPPALDATPPAASETAPATAQMPAVEAETPEAATETPEAATETPADETPTPPAQTTAVEAVAPAAETPMESPAAPVEASAATESATPEATSTEATPATPADAGAPAEGSESRPDFTKLAEPEVVSRLKLTAQQLQQVTDLLADRQKRLAEATDATRAAAVEASDRDLSGVLTEAQLGEFSGKPVPKRLRFTFRFQKWSEVLEWFAEQAELSLVLDAPPPGTFNYSDPKEYTPTEAIDVLNSVLITKGFSLIRRDQMLMVIDLRQGLPEGLIPQVAPEELSQRGKFEMVMVSFPLGKKPVEGVAEAITPLLSPHGKVVALAATKQVIVTDVAGVMPILQRVIEAIPEPAAPRAKPAPAKPVPPVMQVHPLVKADSEAVVSVLATLMPTAKVVYDPNLKHLNAYATPPQQEAIASVIEKMEATVPPDEAPRLEVYPIEALLGSQAATAGLGGQGVLMGTFSESQLLETLQPIVPEAKLSINSDDRALVAWGTLEDQEKVKSALEKLGESPPQFGRQLEVYPVARANSATLLPLLQTLAPHAKITFDEPTRNLVVLAAPADQQAIRNTLEGLRTGLSGSERPVLQIYRLTTASPTELATALSALVPEGQITPDEVGKRLLVVAPLSHQEMIKKAIEGAEGSVPPEEQPRFEVYEIPGAGGIATAGVLLVQLQSLVPGVSLTLSPQGNRIIGYATPKEHERLAAALEKLGHGTTPETMPTVEVYPLTKADPASTLTLLQSLVPGAQLALDTNQEKLMVTAVAADHERVKATLEKLQPETPGPEAPVLRFHALSKEAPADLVTLLTGLAPKARITHDPANGRLMAVASAADHALIESTIKEYESTSAEKRLLRFHPLMNEVPADLVTILQGVVPSAQITLDSPNKRLVVVATPEDQDRIAATVEEYESSTPPDEPSKLVIYPVSATQRKRFDTVLPSLAEELPAIRVVPDSQPGELAIWAKLSEHEVLSEIIEQLEQAVSRAAKLVAYPIRSTDPANVLAMLQTLYPETQFVLDAKTGRLLVWARPEEHASVEASIAEIDGGVSPEEQRRFESFSLSMNDTSEVVATLGPLVPNARLSVDTKAKRLIVWGTRAEVELVRTAVAGLSRGKPADHEPRLELYPIRNTDPQTTLTLLQGMVPDAQYTLDAASGRLIVFAAPVDHEAIRSTLDRLETTGPAESQPRFESYSLHAGASSTIATTLNPLVPKAALSVDVTARKLVAWATPEEHAILGRAVEALGPGGSPETTPQLEVYQLTKADPQTALLLLTNLLPEAKLSVDPQTGNLAALAVPEDQLAIRGTISQLEFDDRGPDAPALRFYPMEQMPPEDWLALFQTATPKARVTLDAKGKRVMALATPGDHALIEQAVNEYATATPAPEPNRLVVYPVTATQKSRLDALVAKLTEELPGIEVISDTVAGNVAIWANPTQHTLLTGILEQLRQDAPRQGDLRLEAHAVHTADPTSVVSMLERLFGETKFQLDPKTGRVWVWALPERQEAIRKALEQLDEEIPREDQPQFETYSLTAVARDSTAAAGIVATLQALVPSAKLTLDPKGRSLVGWGTPRDHAMLRKALEKLDQEGSVSGAVQLEIYPITKADPSSALALLQTLVPDAQLTLDPAARRLVALAVSADHETIRATLERLQPEKPGPDAPLLRFHALLREPSPNLATILGELVPHAQVTLDVENDRVMAVATPGDHEVIASTIGEFESSTPPEEPNRLSVYHVTPSQRRRFEALFPTLSADLPGVQMLPESTPGELAVWAKPSQHLLLAGIIEELTAEGPAEGQPELAAYPIRSVDPASVVAMLERLFGDVEFVLDAKTRRVLVWARAREQARVKAAIEQIDSGVPADMEEEFAVYPISDVDPTVVLQMLQELVPDARLSSDPQASTILAWARKQDHQTIAATLDRMQEGPAEGKKPRLVVYPTSGLDSQTVSLMLSTLVPKARLAVDSQTGGLAALATPDDHETIRATLLEMTKEEVGGGGPALETYPLEWIPATSAMGVLGSAVPRAKLSQGTSPRQLIAWATPRDHVAIQGILEQIDTEGTDASQVVIYSFEGMDSTAVIYAYRFLASAFPYARLASGVEPDKLVVWAPPKDHKEIAALVEQLTKAPPPEKAAKAVVYTLKEITATTATQVLGTAVPGAKLTPDAADPRRLTVWAKPDEHQMIEGVLSEIDIEGSAESASKVVVYTLEGVDSRSSSASYYLQQFLTTAVPGARFTSGAQPDQIVAWATPKQHEEIAALIEQLTEEPPPEKAAKAVVYTLKEITATTATQVLGTAVPGAKLTPDAADSQRLTVWAKPDEHEMIESVLSEIDIEGSAAGASTVVVYTLEGVDSRSSSASYYLQRFLSSAVPTARFTTGVKPNQIVAWATPTQHEEIAALVEQMTKEPPPEKAAKVVVYTLEGGNSQTAYYLQRFLMSAVPAARFTSGMQPDQIVAWATPTEHEQIGALIEQMSEEPPPEKAAKAVVYTLKEISAAAATQVLNRAVPEAELTTDQADTQRLTAWAKPAEHEMIESVLAEIDIEGSAAGASTVVIYTLEGASSRSTYYAQRFLASAVPTARFTTGTEESQLVAWATPKEHEEIAALVEQLTKGPPPEKAPRAELYSLEGISSRRVSYVVRFLMNAVPTAGFTLAQDGGQLIAWATPKDQQRVASLVEQLTEEPPPEKAAKAVVYTLKEITATAAMQVLGSAVPGAELTTDPAEPQRLTAWAKPPEHQMIEGVLTEIDTEGSAENASKVVVYSLKEITSEDARAVLELAVPRAEFSSGSESDQLVAWARPADQQMIEATLLEIDVKRPDDEAARAVVYPLVGMDRIAGIYAVRLLIDAVPEATFTLGAEGDRLVAWANPEDHAVIADLVKQLVDEMPELARQAEVHNLKRGTAAAAMQVLQRAVPEAALSTGSDPNQLVAWARPTEQETIRKIIEQMEQEGPSEMAFRLDTYDVGTASAANIRQALVAIVPGASVSLGADPHQLVAWARPEDHVKIGEAVEQMSDTGENAATVVVYPLESADASDALTLLQNAVPDARLTISSDASKLYAYARPKEHTTLQAALEELAAKGPTGSEPTAVTYSLESADVVEAMRILRTAVPQARLTQGARSDQLIAWARPADHEMIRQLIDRIVDQGPAELAPRMVVYDVEAVGAAAAIQILQPVVPQARLGVGTESSKLIAWARPDDHTLIESTVEQLEAESWLEGNRIMSVYAMPSGDAASLLQMLGPVLENHAQFVVDAERNSLIVWAEAKYHEAIQETIGQFAEGLASAPGTTTEVYRFENADPTAAFTVLQSLVPSAQLAFDRNNQSIVASALPDDHAKIKATVEEMDREDAGGQRPVLKLYRIRAGETGDVYRTVYLLFRLDPTVQLSVDSANDSLVAIASPAKHKKIEEIIAKLEEGYLVHSDSILQFHSMAGIDEQSALDVLDQVLEQRGMKVDKSLDSRRNQLVVIARPDQQALVGETLEQLRGEEPELEIYDLDYVDPLSAESAIAAEFFDDGWDGPQIDIDPITQQLFVRATGEQHEQIRQLLIKMGESKLTLLGDRGTAAMRTVPFQGDLNATLEQIERVWPQLRPNRIRVVTPSMVLPPAKPKAAEPKSTEPKVEKPTAADQKKEASDKEKKKQPAQSPRTEKPVQKSEKPAADDAAVLDAWRTFALCEPGSPTEEDQRESTSTDPKRAEPKEEAKTAEPNQAADGQAEPDDDAMAPVYLVPGNGTVTIVSDDPEALEQMEELLKTLSPQTGRAGRNISIFELKNSEATVVAGKLERLFTSDSYRWRGMGSVVIVPDERLNTILVQGSRTERETIESLLRILDTDAVPEALASKKPKLIPIKHLDAEKVAEVIREIFRVRSTTSSSRSRSTTSSTSSRPQVAVDETTNSLVVMAPPALMNEITSLANTLDEAAAEDPARRVKIIPLKKASAPRVEEALERILRRGSTGRR